MELPHSNSTWLNIPLAAVIAPLAFPFAAAFRKKLPSETMILQLRRRHRRIMFAIAIILPVLFVCALWFRNPLP